MGTVAPNRRAPARAERSRYGDSFGCDRPEDSRPAPDGRDAVDRRDRRARRPVADAVLEADPAAGGRRRDRPAGGGARSGEARPRADRLRLDRDRRPFAATGWSASPQPSRRCRRCWSSTGWPATSITCCASSWPTCSAYDSFYKQLIAALPLKNVTSRFAMEKVKSTTALPLPAPPNNGRQLPGTGSGPGRGRRIIFSFRTATNDRCPNLQIERSVKRTFPD